MKISRTLIAIFVVLALSGLATLLEIRGRMAARHPGLPQVVPDASAEVSPGAPAAPTGPLAPRHGPFPRIG